MNGTELRKGLFADRIYRMGTENAFKIGPHITRVENQGHKVVRLNLGEPDFDMPPFVKDEVKRQLDKFYSFGFKADHIDSHHHAHLHPEIFPIFTDVAKDYKIPSVRFFSKFYPDRSAFEAMKKMLLEKGFTYFDHFIEGWYWGNIDESYETAELMTHPGYGELWREAELAHCCQPQLKQYLIDQKVDLLRFSDVSPR